MKRRKIVEPADSSVFFAVLAMFLIVFVLLFSELIDCGYEIERARKRYQELLTMNQFYQAEILRLSSLPSLCQRMQQYGLSLCIPEKWSWWKFSISPQAKTGAVNGKNVVQQ